MNDLLTLSLFPGIGMLDRAFEEEGFCIVRGPDVLWGGDIHRFHPPAGVFGGIIGGDPCQSHSVLANLVRASGREPRYPDMTPEYVRVVTEAQPDWFLRENVRGAPDLAVEGYRVTKLRLSHRWVGGQTQRERVFWFGSRYGRALVVDVVLFEEPLSERSVVTNVVNNDPIKKGRKLSPPPTVISGHGGTIAMRERGQIGRWPIPVMCELQDLPPDFLAGAPFTMDEKRRVIANGVPLRMGRAVAKAVRRAVMDGVEQGRTQDHP